MSNVTAADVNFMKQLQTIVEGGNVSLNSAPTNPAYGQKPNIGFTPDNPSMYIDDMKKFIRIVEGVETPSHNTERPSMNRHTSHGSNYEVVVDINESGRIYFVKNENREIYENKIFHVFEAAMGTCKSLNGQCNDKTDYIREFIELDTDFGDYKEKALGAKIDYNKSMKINESQLASVFENKFKKYQNQANTVYESIKTLFGIAMK